MNIEELKLIFGWKKIPMMFYIQGMFALIFPVALVAGLICRFLNINILIGCAIVLPWCVFVGWKANNKYQKDKMKEKEKCLDKKQQR
jgi:hypothetical protein